MLEPQVPPEFREFVSQDGKQAKLVNCGLSALPEWLKTLPDLTVLNLDGNQLTTLPVWLGSLFRLQSISLNDNQLTALPGWLGSLPRLISLSLTRNELTTLPDSVGDFSALFYLYLDGNKLTTLPDWLGSLPQLSRLNLADNQLTTLSDSVCNLVGMRYLNLNGNKLTMLPESVGNLTRLAELYLRGNQLVTLPESVGNLTRLTRLDLDGNQLTILPESVGDLTALTYFRLEDNQLTALPESVGHLASLNYFTLEGNQLTGLPESMSNLTALDALYLKGNQLTALPQSLRSLPRLGRLGLEGNQLSTLPEWVGELSSLVRFGIARNRLTTLPDSVGNLSRLTVLKLYDNPLRSPLREIAEDGTEAVKDYLALLSDDAVERWVSKLLVVGEGAVGKTSLVKRLSGQPYDRNESTTHGIRIADIILNHPTREKVDMRLSSWDFGGQDIYHATHQFFLTDRSMFLLLWNARQGWEQSKIPYWLDIIKARAPHARIMLVATHAKDRPADLPLNDLRNSYPQIVDSAIVDNETGDGIDELRKKLASQAAELPLMGSRWPTSWVAGVEAITTQRLKHATPEDLFDRLAQAGVTDRSHQRYLLRALHLLGDILYFDEDEDLRDTVILQPQWVSGYIAKVLDSHDVAARKGILTRSHERDLWSDLEPGLRDRFLTMMERFDLSYRITDDPAAASLIVEQLRWDNPPYQALWDDALINLGAQEIRLRYKLSTVPPGVPTWFIAREHRFTTGLQWRAGALLRHTDPRVLGLIRTDHADNVVDLTVRGPVPQNFFSILQDGFESTLSRYQGLGITKMVPCSCAQGNGDQPGQPCLNLYDYSLLLRRIERGIREVECPLSFQKVDVAELLFGIAPTGADIISRLDNIDHAVKAVGQDVKDARADSAWKQRELLKAIRRVQKQAEATCPTVFTLTHAAERIRRPGMYRLELRLYCEEPGAMHATVEPPYPIEQPTQWLKKMAPYLNVMIMVLKHAVPLATPVLGITSEYLANQLSNDIGLMAELVTQLPADVPAGPGIEEELRPPELDVDYRALQALLDQVDPNHHWAGLSRIRTPEEEILWLCRDHAQQHR